MNRAQVQQTFNAFFERAACAMVADVTLVQHYLTALQAYIVALEQEYDAIDQWSLQELEHATEFLLHNQQWITDARLLQEPLQQAFTAIGRHRIFLAEHGLMPDYLVSIPVNVFV